MELRQLRYFQAVAEELSFSKASQRLRVAQPALSRTIKDLETELGVLLLERTRRMVKLTAPGAVLLHEAGVLLQRVEEVGRRVKRTAAGEEGEVRVGFIGPPTNAFLGRLLQEFQRRHPRVSVVLEERTPERVWEMVARGRLEIGLTRPVLAHGAIGLRTTLLRHEPLVAVLAADHPLAARHELPWHELAGQPLVLLSRREGVGLHDEILAACRRARFTPRLAYTPSLVSTVMTYVEAGAGIGVISDSVASLGTGRPLVFRPLVPTHTVDLVMVWLQQDDSPPATAFRKLVQDWSTAGKLWKP